MPRFTDDELHRLAEKHEAETRPGLFPFAPPAPELRAIDTARERGTLTRFAEIPAYDDAEGRRAALPTYTDLPGVSRWPRAALVWRSRAEEDAAPGAEAWNVTVQDTPMPEPGEKARQLGPYTSWAEAMEAARDEARYIVQRPAQPTPATTARVAELRAASFTDPTDAQAVCS